MAQRVYRGLGQMFLDPKQSNGLAECFEQTVKAILKKCKAENSDTELALLCLRTTLIDAEIPSPAELLYMRKIKANLPVKLDNLISTKDRVYQQLMHRQNTQKIYHDKGAHELPPLTAKQPVYVQNEMGKWEKGTISGTREEPRSYDVTKETGSTLRGNRRHIKEKHAASPNPETVSEVPTNCEKQATIQPPSPMKTRSGRVVARPE